MPNGLYRHSLRVDSGDSKSYVEKVNIGTFDYFSTKYSFVVIVLLATILPWENEKNEITFHERSPCD